MLEYFGAAGKQLIENAEKLDILGKNGIDRRFQQLVFRKGDTGFLAS
jgi:hypothetical protein